MKYLTGTTTVSNWSITLRKLWFRVKIGLVIVALLEIYAVWNNPVILLKQGKAWNAYWEARSRRITYNLIKEIKGSTIADMYDAKNVWGDFGNDMRKSWRDTLSIFRGY